MGDRAAAAGAAGAKKDAFGGTKGAARSGLGAVLHDKKKMAGIAEGLGMLGDQMQPEAPPAPMSPMAMGGGEMANGDPAALAAAMAARRQMMAPPSILDRMQRFRGGY